MERKGNIIAAIIFICFAIIVPIILVYIPLQQSVKIGLYFIEFGFVGLIYALFAQLKYL